MRLIRLSRIEFFRVDQVARALDVALPVIGLLAGLTISLIPTSGIRENVREVREDICDIGLAFKLLTGKVGGVTLDQ